jgi:hypothetical protein
MICFFPIYSWICKNDDRVFFGGLARLPNDPELSPHTKELRTADLAYQQKVYEAAKMIRVSNLPAGMSDHVSIRFCCTSSTISDHVK